MKERKGNNSSYESKREKAEQRLRAERSGREKPEKTQRKRLSRKARKRLRKQEYLREKKKRAVNKEFASVTYAFVCLFLLLMGYIGYFTAMTSQEIIKSPYNPRLDSMATGSYGERSLTGTALYWQRQIMRRTANEYRYYPYRDIFAHVVGYSVQGKSGLESTANFELLTSNAFILEKLRREFATRRISEIMW